MRKLLLYAKMLRVRQWTKNLLVFLPAFISPYEIGIQNLYFLIMTFGLFCCSASLIYIVNDWTDRKLDAMHENKKHRPFASKELNLQDAVIGLSLLSIIFLYLCMEISKVSFGVSILIIIYLIQSILYSLFLKNITLVEMLIVSTGYSYRVLAGGLSISLLPSTWMLLTIFLASLFMIAQKRLSDKSCVLSQDQLRPSIRAYSDGFLTAVTIISAAAAIIMYILFTLSDYAQVKFQNPYLPISSIFIIYATFRYLQVSTSSSKAHDPIQLIIQDRHINGCILLCLVFIVITNTL
jgi:decaprenyl-phosphate phosphoribosyltransferase